MPNSSSSDSEGGAPLRDASPSPVKTGSNSGDERERALIQASVKFGSFDSPGDPFTSRPHMPQSVRPMTDVGTPGRWSGGRNRGNSRARVSFSSESSYAPAGEPQMSREDIDNAVQGIHRILLTTLQMINTTPGIAGSRAKIFEANFQRTSRLITQVTNTLTSHIEELHRVRLEQHKNFQTALYDSTASRQHRDKLQHELSVALQREDQLRNDHEMLKGELKNLKGRMDAIFESTEQLRQHHHNICSEYEDKDERHRQRIMKLEEEIRTLRRQTGPASLSSSTTLIRTSDLPSDSSSLSDRVLVKKEDTPTTSSKSWAFDSFQSPSQAADLNDSEISDEPASNWQVALRGPFNPQAPAWTPAGTIYARDLAPDHASRPRHDATHQTPTQRSGQRPRPANTQTFPRTPTAFQPDPPNARPGMALAYYPRRPAYEETYGSPEPHGSASSSQARSAWGREGYMSSSGEDEGLASSLTVSRVHDVSRAHDELDVRAAMAHLMELVKGAIVKAIHVDGSPPHVPDDRIQLDEPQTWQYLIETVFPDPRQGTRHMEHLIGEPMYRPFVLQRLILDFLFQRILCPDVFLGFTPQIDEHLKVLQARIKAFANGGLNNPRVSGIERQKLLDQYAALVGRILTHPAGREFRSAAVDRHARVLTLILKPLRSRAVGDAEAFDHLRTVAAAAWEANARLWSGAVTLNHVFPACGSKFAAATMDCLNWRQMGRDPEHLQHAQYRVLLVVSPTMSVRDDRDGAVKTLHVRKAEVLVMK